ncbi:MAG: hypothetical protein K2O88_01960 [Paramuribaculum sp.]|nr:hypothetical protein [Paramuribaculum sp.]
MDSTPLQAFLNTVSKAEAPLPQLTDALAELYPYFTLPAAMELKHSSPPSERRQLLMARVALNAANPRTLFSLMDSEGPRFARFYPDLQTSVTPTTEDALDTFMQNYGNPDPKEQALLEKLIFNPVATDYASVLIKESQEEPQSEPAVTSEQDSRLDAFLASYPAESSRMAAPAPEQAHHKARKVSTPAADSPLSESLAKFYIKRHRYDKAYEIISQLSLNFPEKSIYFADQLRFLRKLIASQRLANNK